MYIYIINYSYFINNKSTFVLLGKLPYFCDFERDFCGISQRSNDDFDWLRIDRATPTDGTGPNKAQHMDYFVYSEMSSPRIKGDKA